MLRVLIVKVYMWIVSVPIKDPVDVFKWIRLSLEVCKSFAVLSCR